MTITKQWRKETWINNRRPEGNSRAEEEHIYWSAFLLCLWATALRKSRSAHQVVDCATFWCWTLLRMLFLCNTRVPGTVQCISSYSITENVCLKGDGKLSQPFWNIFSKIPVMLQNWPISEHIFLWTSQLFHWKHEKLPSTLHPYLHPFQTAYTRPASEPLKALHMFFLYQFSAPSTKLSPLSLRSL